MFGKFNINNLMENAQKMQGEMEKIHVTGESGAGAISITMNLRHYVSKLTISDEVINEPKDVLEELICGAINDAANKVEDATKDQMSDMNSLFGSIMNSDDKKDK